METKALSPVEVVRENLINKIQAILEKELPEGCYINVSKWDGMDWKYIKIFFAASDYLIHGVRGQMPQAVSLSLCLNTKELKVQIYGGMGGQDIYRDINPEKYPRETYLAMGRERVPFKQPKKEEKFILAAIERFAQKWRKLIKEHKDVLKYRDKVDYSKF